MSKPPVIIVGAARSGTKLLRALVASSLEYHEVPHDVNYVWRYGSEQIIHDELSIDSATPKMKKFVRHQLNVMASKSGLSSVPFVEKTVSNTLRLPLVNAVFPNAIYVHLVRDGYSVTESSLRCWQEPTEYRRILSKIRTFPWSSCARYAAWYAWGNLGRKFSATKQPAVWGPRYQGIQDAIARLTLPEVCAWQWRHCVEHALANKSIIANDRWLDLSYEELIANPSIIAKKISNFLNIKQPSRMIEFAEQRVNRAAKMAQDTTFRSDSPVHGIIAPVNQLLGFSKSNETIAA